MIIHNLLRHKGRTTMCITAIAISTALLVSLLSVAEGIWQNASQSLLSSREDIIIRPNLPSGNIELWGISNGHKIADNIKIDSTNISEVSPMYLSWLGMSSIDPASGNKSNELNTPVNTEPNQLIPVVISLGVVPERFKQFFVNENTYNLDIIELTFEQWFKIPGDPHYQDNFTGPWTYEILIDDHLANEYNLELGSKVNLSIVNENPVTFTVVGIFKTNLKNEYFEDFFELKGLVILHLSELQSLADVDVTTIDDQTIVDDKITTIAISLNNTRPKGNSPEDIAYSIKEKYPHLDVLTKEDRLKALEEQNALTRVFYLAISIVAVIIGLLFVACIMLISVYERINEIGMLRAIGISRGTIFKWVILESLLLIIIGILIGFLPGYFGSELLGEQISNDIGIAEDLTAFSPELIIYSFAGMLGLGTLISLIPAIRASYMKITDAISFVR